MRFRIRNIYLRRIRLEIQFPSRCCFNIWKCRIQKPYSYLLVGLSCKLYTSLSSLILLLTQHKLIKVISLIHIVKFKKQILIINDFQLPLIIIN